MSSAASDGNDTVAGMSESEHAPDQTAARPAQDSHPISAPQETETLTVAYERLRHATDSAALTRVARAPLPERSDQAAFSRATALLEAVAGNLRTPAADRVFLAASMPFPNVLVKLSQDPESGVRRAVAGNKADKSWLVGRLTKDVDADVRNTALLNPRTSWKMRLEGAEDPRTSPRTLAALAHLGADVEPDAPAVLATMVRRAVALNPNADAQTRARLAADAKPEVARAAHAAR